jgi:hypothetical protein
VKDHKRATAVMDQLLDEAGEDENHPLARVWKDEHEDVALSKAHPHTIVIPAKQSASWNPVLVVTWRGDGSGYC